MNIMSNSLNPEETPSYPEQGLPDRYITSLGTKIGAEWSLFGVSLGFCQAQLDQLQHAFPRNVSECVIQLLKSWRSVTVEHSDLHPGTILAEALAEVGRSDLAQEVRDEFKITDNCQGHLDKAVRQLEDELWKVRFRQDMPAETDKLVAQTKQCIARWKDNAKLYVVTRAWRSAHEIFYQHNTLLICGNSGDGKSTLAYYLLSNIIEKGGTVINVTKPEAIETVYDPDDKVVFLVDDAFGTPTVNNQLVEAWIRLYNKFLSFHESGNFGLILTTRTHVFKSCYLKLSSYPLYAKHTIDLDDKDNNLSQHEKRQILEKYCADKGVLLPDTVLDQIKSSSLSGFPLLCKLYAADEHLQQVNDFFCTPLSVLNQQLQTLSAVEPITYCGLVLILTHDGKLPVDYFDVFSQTDQSRTHIAMIKEACTVEVSVPLTRIQDGLETLVGVYVTEYDEFYTFLHDAIFDAVTFVFGQKFPRQVLKVCSPKFLHDRVRSENARLSIYSPSTIRESTSSSSATDVLFIPKSYNKDIAKRFISDIKKGYLYEVFDNPSVLDQLIQRLITAEVVNMPDSERSSFLHRRDRNLGKHVMQFVCSLGIVPMADIFINHGADVDSDLLVAACDHAKGHEEMVDLLIDKGVDINEIPDSYANNAIQIAAMKGNDNLVKHLIKLGAHVNAKCKSETEAIHFACISGSVSCVEVLFSHGANPKAEDAFRRQPIHLAAKQGAEDCLKFVVGAGADIHARDAFGNQGLHMASGCTSPDTLQFLLSEGCDPNSQNKDGMTPLHIACLNGRTKNVHILISYGAYVTIPNNQKKQPVHHACISTNYEPRDIDVVVDSNINSRDKEDSTPLHYACQHVRDNSLEKVKVLLELGANIHGKDNTGMQPLMYACNSNSFLLSKLLIENGADVRAKSRKSRQPIHFACAKGNTKLLTLLIENGADPRAKSTDEGKAPIHFASRNGKLQVVKRLLDLGVDVNEKDEAMFTPLFYACFRGYPGIAQMLLERGADPNCTDYKHRKPVEMLQFRPCDFKLREILEKYSS